MSEEPITKEFLKTLDFQELSDPYQTMQLWVCPDFEKDHSIYLSWNTRFGFFYGPDHRPCPVPIHTQREITTLCLLFRRIVNEEK